MIPIRLTLQQEQDLLHYLHLHNEELYLGCGSSRAVFSVSEEMKEILGLIDVNRDLVIKMSLGCGGYLQSNLEYNTYLEYAHTCILADIFARGCIFTVMESLDIDEDFFDLYDCGDADAYCEEAGIDSNSEIDRYNEVLGVIYQLNNIFGETADNAQIGVDAYGYFKAYDYGFECCSDHVQTTKSSHYFRYRDNGVEEFFDLLSSALAEAISNDVALNQVDFDNIENDYCCLFE